MQFRTTCQSAREEDGRHNRRWTAQRNWPNAHAFDEFRSHFVSVGRIDQMRCAIGQSRSAFEPNEPNALRIWAIAQRI